MQLLPKYNEEFKYLVEKRLSFTYVRLVQWTAIPNK